MREKGHARLDAGQRHGLAHGTAEPPKGGTSQTRLVTILLVVRVRIPYRYFVSVVWLVLVSVLLERFAKRLTRRRCGGIWELEVHRAHLVEVERRRR